MTPYASRPLTMARIRLRSSAVHRPQLSIRASRPAERALSVPDSVPFWLSLPMFPDDFPTGSNPVPAIRPVLVTGAIPEEPAVTRVVSAGSVVSCGAVLPDADACGVAFRVSMDAQFTLHSVGLPCPPSAQCLGIPAPGPSRRGSPVRSHGVRLSKRTGLVYWRAKS